MPTKSFQIKKIDDTGTGLARIATLNVVDKDEDVTRPGAFGEQVAKFLPAHDWNSVWLGKARIYEHDDQVLADFRLNLDLPAARDWHSALKFDLNNGTPLAEWSYGFSILKASDGLHEGRLVRFLEAVKVHEISPVVRGAGEGTATLQVKHAAPVAVGLHRQFIAIASRIKVKPHLVDPDLKVILERNAARRTIEKSGAIPAVRLSPPRWVSDLVTKASQELHLSRPPSAYLFRHALPSEQHDLVLDNCSGVYKKRTCTVYISRDLPVRETVITIGHEVYHHAAAMKDLPNTEYLAEQFGLEFANRYA